MILVHAQNLMSQRSEKQQKRKKSINKRKISDLRSSLCVFRVKNKKSNTLLLYDLCSGVEFTDIHLQLH